MASSSTARAKCKASESAMLDDEKQDTTQLSSPTKTDKNGATEIAADKSKHDAHAVADSNQSAQSKSTPSSAVTINRSFVKNSRRVSHDTGNSNHNNSSSQSRPERATANLSINVAVTTQPPPPKSSSYASKVQMYAHPKRVHFDNELVLQNLIRAQIEYLFSDYHLTNDTYLLARMQDNAQHWLSVDELCHNQKIRCLTIKKERVLQALRDSAYLELSSDGERVRRPDFTLPKLRPNRDLRRTVFLYGIPVAKGEHELRKLLVPHGQIKRIHFEPETELPVEVPFLLQNEEIDDEAPNREVSQLIMRKKFLFPSRFTGSDRDSDTESNRGGSSTAGGGGFTPRSATADREFDSDVENMSVMSGVSGHSGVSGVSGMSRRDVRVAMMHDVYAHPLRNPNGDAQDFSHLKTAFIVFESQSQATKCVKARVRAADGMRCIHKYDYNKVAKKYRTAQMKGEDLTFSPPPQDVHASRESSRDRNGGGGDRASSAPGHAEHRHWDQDRDRGESPGYGYGGGGGGGRGRFQQRFGGGPHAQRGGSGGRGGGYQSYRDRSHSMDSNSGGAGGYNNYHTARSGGRNFQRPNAGQNSGGGVYSLGGRKNRPSHTDQNSNNGEHASQQQPPPPPSSSSYSQSQSHRMGSRADRHSHEKTNSHHAQAVHSHARADGVRKSPGSQQQHKTRSYSFGSGDSIPAPNLMMMNAHKQPPQQPPQQQQQQLPKPDQMAMARSHSAHVSASPTVQQPPQQPQQLPPTRQLQQQQQQTTEGQQQSSTTTPAAPQLYHPIGSNAALPTRQDADALKAAGYQHELYYLNMDDLNIIDDQLLNDPLVAYDAYFGVDPSGNPLSTSVAAKQLQEQQLQMQQQPRHPPQQPSQQRYRGQQQQQPQRQSYSQSQSQSQSQYHHHHGQQQPQQQHYSQPSRLNANAAHYQQQQQEQPPQPQQSTYGARYGYNQTTQAQTPQQQQRYGRYQQSSSSSSNGVTSTQAQAQYNPQQWQLDKLERFKAEKTAEMARKQPHGLAGAINATTAATSGAQTGVGQQQVTALSVMSSSN